MITTMLSGGLGNQMFQYAAGKSLAIRLNTQLKLDVSSFSTYAGSTQRQFELNIFNIDEKTSGSLACRLLIKSHKWDNRLKCLYKKIGVFTDGYAIRFCPEFDNIKNKKAILFGYFQNPQYFKDVEHEIRKTFTFKRELKGQNLTLSEKIKNSNSVSIHIRRGDYISNKGAASNFVTCNAEYYHRAIGHIVNVCPDAVFFVFSEEFEWIRENIDFRGYPVHLIDWNKGQASYFDLQLMSLCKHNIIANSSFSWWGAWLNSNDAKIVIAPDKWFKEDAKNKLLPAFYPGSWLRL